MKQKYHFVVWKSGGVGEDFHYVELPTTLHGELMVTPVKCSMDPNDGRWRLTCLVHEKYLNHVKGVCADDIVW